jgi:ribosomal protein S18 acetylase RimI-like enzyme
MRAQLPLDLFTDPIWHALHSRHGHLALVEGDACRYRPDVAPFAALARPTELALWELHSLLAPGESVWLAGTGYPNLPELRHEGTLECAQMVLTEKLIPESLAGLDRLSGADSEAMLALTDVAFPGFFRSHTYEMGAYFGVWLDSRGASGSLIAMAGERMALEGYAEISGVCTDPAHRGKGLAARLIARVAMHQREQDVTSFLHVATANTKAIDLYVRLGFVEARRITLTRLSRAEAGS